MTFSDWITLAAIAAVGFAVWLGRRKGKARFAASVAAARAEGHADARAELAAQLTNQVVVNAGNTGLHPGQSDTTDDVLLAALRRVAVSGSVDNGPDSLDAAPDHFGALLDRARLVGWSDDRGRVEQLPADRAGGSEHRVTDAHVLGNGSEVER